MNRDELQGIAAYRLAQSRRLVCVWATGLGKSRVVLRFLESNPDFLTLIVVPEQDNINNWREEFRKFNVPDDRVTIICYASIHKYKDSWWDLLVLDEVPHMDTEKRIKMLRSVNAKYVAALGAVVDDDEMGSLRSVYGDFEISRVTLARAIQLGILPKLNVIVLHMQLDEKAKKQYDAINKKVDGAVSAFNANATHFNKQRMLRAGNERKRFLGAQKEEAIRKVCDMLDKQGKRYLCFCSSISQAEKLGGHNAYTSKSLKSMAHLKRFNNHEIDSLYVVGKLIEGQNLKDIDCGVIGQLGGTSRITVQEIGRIIRSENPIVYIPIFDDTKDNSFLYTVTSNISADCIKHYKF